MALRIQKKANDFWRRLCSPGSISPICLIEGQALEAGPDDRFEILSLESVQKWSRPMDFGSQKCLAFQVNHNQSSAPGLRGADFGGDFRGTKVLRSEVADRKRRWVVE